MDSKQILRRLVPRPLRKLLGPGLHYCQRLGRWPIILVQVRGFNIADEAKLLVSALAAPLVSLRGLMQWQDPVLLFDATVVVRGVGVFKARKQTDDLWHVLPWREREIHRILRDRLAEGKTFVDAGANIGVYTVLAASLVGNTGRVVAVEMIPETAALLREHVTLNGLRNVTVVERALSNHSGDRVTAVVPRGKYGQASITPMRKHLDTEEISVETTTLDRVCSDLRKIELMKLDLEGAESSALAGAAEVLARTDAIIYEAIGEHGASQRLENGGFVVRPLGGKDRLAEAREGLQ